MCKVASGRCTTIAHLKRNVTLRSAKMARRIAAIAPALAVAIAVSRSPAAAAQPSQYLDIPAGQLEVSIRALARQAGMQVLFPYENVVGRTAPELRGVFDPVVALGILAKVGGLRIAARDGRTITLSPAPTSAPVAAPAPRSARPGAGRRPPVKRVEPDRESARARVKAAALPGEEVGETVVTASRVNRLGFNAPTPTTVLNAA